MGQEWSDCLKMRMRDFGVMDIFFLSPVGWLLREYIFFSKLTELDAEISFLFYVHYT